jgi:hypothetical protein
MYLQGRIYNYQKRSRVAVLVALGEPISAVEMVATVSCALNVTSATLLTFRPWERFPLRFEDDPKSRGGLYKTITQEREVVIGDGIVTVRDFPSDSNLISDILYVKRRV